MRLTVKKSFRHIAMGQNKGCHKAVAFFSSRKQNDEYDKMETNSSEKSFVCEILHSDSSKYHLKFTDLCQIDLYLSIWYVLFLLVCAHQQCISILFAIRFDLFLSAFCGCFVSTFYCSRRDEKKKTNRLKHGQNERTRAISRISSSCLRIAESVHMTVNGN